jgi:hypothetical protein
MTSSLQPATIVLCDQEKVNEHIEDFVSYLEDIVDWYYGPVEFDPLNTDYPDVFKLAINQIPAHAKVIDIGNMGRFIANLAICYATNATGQTFFFILIRESSKDWQPTAHALHMSWEQFIQLSKAQQYTALNC